jgi:hypothetical protein
MIISRRNYSDSLSALVVAAALGIPAPVQPAVAQVITSITVGTDKTLSYSTDLTTLPDEHTTFFPELGPNGVTYLVFAASNLVPITLSGTVALTTSDLTTFTLAPGYTTNPVMVPPLSFTTCNPTYNTEFDENYAAPGSVLQDPTRPAGHFIMIYEAENHCPGGVNQGPFYATVGLTRSTDYGKTWPAPSPKEYGDIYRRPVLKMNMDEPAIPFSALGNAIPSAFIDTATGDPYIYVTYMLYGPANYGYLRMARANLVQRPLDFFKWYVNMGAGSFSQQGIHGLDSGVTPSHGCENTQPPVTGQTAEYQHGGSISYFATTKQYLLTFVCVQLTGTAPNYQAAQAGWYYSTATSLEKQDWTPPQLILGSQMSAANCSGGQMFDGWYPSFMTPSSLTTVYQPGQLGNNGLVFFLYGCNGSLTPRQFRSRQFWIMTGP